MKNRATPVTLAACMLLPLIAACDSNSAPKYGSSGLPENCRAFVQYAIDSYRNGQHSADSTMVSLTRNCGEHGQLWSR